MGNLNNASGYGTSAAYGFGLWPKTTTDANGQTTTSDDLGPVTQTLQPDGVSTSTATYDAVGHLTSSTDPDRGLTSFTYDSNGNLTQQTDARCGTSLPQTACSAGTTYTGYDGLNRPIWRNNSSTPGGAYVANSYDGSPFGNGLGRLTAEVFRGDSGTSATSFSGAYTYTQDALGQSMRTDQTVGEAGACPPGWTCQDIGGPGKAGSQSYAGDGIWTVSGGGADIVGTSDQFHFVSASQSGDVALSPRVETQTNTDPWAKAGLMARVPGTAGLSLDGHARRARLRRRCVRGDHL